MLINQPSRHCRHFDFLQCVKNYENRLPTARARCQKTNRIKSTLFFLFFSILFLSRNHADRPCFIIRWISVDRMESFEAPFFLILDCFMGDARLLLYEFRELYNKCWIQRLFSSLLYTTDVIISSHSLSFQPKPATSICGLCSSPKVTLE